MTEPKVVRYAVTCHPERIVISEDGAWVQHHDYARLAARVQELEDDIKVIERHELNEITLLREALRGAISEIDPLYTEEWEELLKGEKP